MPCPSCDSFQLLDKLKELTSQLAQEHQQNLRTKVNSSKEPKERMVLIPLRVGEENANMKSAMETALVQGLQQRYEVFSGDPVTQKLSEIYKKERQADETRMLQDIAIAFQSEFIGVANITKTGGGYLLALTIKNVFDDQTVFSKSLPCQGCDVFQLVDKLKELAPQ
jgi:hypothetical protein